MNNAGGHQYQSQTPVGIQRQSFNPYNSYASSERTYYDPQHNPGSQPATWGQQTRFDGSGSQYSIDTRPGADVGQSQNFSGTLKQTYTAGGYADGPPRSPSPTPSELEESKRGAVDFKKLFNWRTYAHKKYIPWFIGGTLILVLVALMTLYHTQIVNWLKPVANWMHKMKYGWLIPIAIMFVISFPPLFGHEIVAVLCGLVWGLGVGFAIVAAGTMLGEIGNFYAFKYCCRSRGEKLEKEKLSYACLARVVREGGFKIALIARLSAIPGHFTTAVFSVCGMGIFVFVLAAALSLPKQFITVYLGVILEQSSETAAQQAANTKSRIISDVVLAITFLITVAAGWYIWREMNRVQPAVLRERRLAKKKLAIPPAETQRLAHASNTDLSEEEMTPVKPNEPRMGAYGYGGFARSEISHETYDPDGDQGEAWTTNGPKMIPHAYPPAQYNNPYSQQAYNQPYSNQPPGPRRTGREGWEDTDSTVRMGSSGGILKEGSGAITHESSSYSAAAAPFSRTLTPGSPTTPRPSQPQQPNLTQGMDGTDEYGMIRTTGGLGALGAPMGGAGTVSVTPRNVSRARQSVEQPGLVGGKSMRAFVEGSPDSDLGYMQGSPPNSHMQHNMSTPTAAPFSQAPSYAEPAIGASQYSGGYHAGHGQDASQAFVHPRQFASSGTSGGAETYMPGAYR